MNANLIEKVNFLTEQVAKKNSKINQLKHFIRDKKKSKPRISRSRSIWSTSSKLPNFSNSRDYLRASTEVDSDFSFLLSNSSKQKNVFSKSKNEIISRLNRCSKKLGHLNYLMNRPEVEPQMNRLPELVVYPNVYYPDYRFYTSSQPNPVHPKNNQKRERKSKKKKRRKKRKSTMTLETISTIIKKDKNPRRKKSSIKRSTPRKKKVKLPSIKNESKLVKFKSTNHVISFETSENNKKFNNNIKPKNEQGNLKVKERRLTQTSMALSNIYLKSIAMSSLTHINYTRSEVPTTNTQDDSNLSHYVFEKNDNTILINSTSINKSYNHLPKPSNKVISVTINSKSIIFSDSYERYKKEEIQRSQLKGNYLLFWSLIKKKAYPIESSYKGLMLLEKENTRSRLLEKLIKARKSIFLKSSEPFTRKKYKLKKYVLAVLFFIRFRNIKKVGTKKSYNLKELKIKTRKITYDFYSQSYKSIESDFLNEINQNIEIHLKKLTSMNLKLDFVNNTDSLSIIAIISKYLGIIRDIFDSMTDHFKSIPFMNPLFLFFFYMSTSGHFPKKKYFTDFELIRVSITSCGMLVNCSYRQKILIIGGFVIVRILLLKLIFVGSKYEKTRSEYIKSRYWWLVITESFSFWAAASTTFSFQKSRGSSRESS